MHAFCNRGDILDDADFVVGEHHRHEKRLGPEGGFEGVERQDTRLRRDRQPRDSEADPLQVLDGVEHGMVFCGDRDHVAAGDAAPRCRTEDREVVGLRGTACKHDLTRRPADGGSDRFPRHVDGGPGLAAHVMGHAAGVAVVVGQPRQQRLEHAGVEPGGRMVVEIDGHD